MQIQIDDEEIIPNIIRATATYTEPSDLIDPTVVITVNIERGKKDHRQLSIDAEKEVERVLRDILELK